jgi:hemerythrin
MGIINWDESYSVGVKELDEQHKQLFRMIDDLFESIDTVVDSQKVSDVLAGLREYASVHFETEERYMSECGYPDIENHKWTHEQFRKKVDNLCSSRRLGRS